jgi:hypothetical protein
MKVHRAMRKEREDDNHLIIYEMAHAIELKGFGASCIFQYDQNTRVDAGL